MAEVATKTNKDVSKALGTEAKNASKVMTAVAGGKKGVVSYAKYGIRTAKKVRQFSRVKHNHKDAILNVKKISYERYLEIVEANHNDQYLNCHSKHEQKLINNFGY